MLYFGKHIYIRTHVTSDKTITFMDSRPTTQRWPTHTFGHGHTLKTRTYTPVDERPVRHAWLSSARHPDVCSFMVCSRFCGHQPSELEPGKSPSFLVALLGGTPPFGQPPRNSEQRLMPPSKWLGGSEALTCLPFFRNKSVQETPLRSV